MPKMQKNRVLQTKEGLRVCGPDARLPGGQRSGSGERAYVHTCTTLNWRTSHKYGRKSHKPAKPSFPLLFGERDRPVHFLPVGKAVL